MSYRPVQLNQLTIGLFDDTDLRVLNATLDVCQECQVLRLVSDLWFAHECLLVSRISLMDFNDADWQQQFGIVYWVAYRVIKYMPVLE